MASHITTAKSVEVRPERQNKMASILRTIHSQWHYLFTELSDERTKGWFMTGSPFPGIILLIAYYQFVKKIGPELMKDRKPFNLDKIIQIYNIIQVAVCSWMAYESFRITYGWNGNYNWTCQPMDNSKSPTAIKVATFSWLFYMLKLFDLLDTVFFVLRKKFGQISFLHVYHHIGVTVLGYIGSKYYPDGHGFIIVPLNSFVHAFMYFYYFFTNYNAEYKKNIWWKKYITQMQIVQFLILTVQLGKVFFMPTCQYQWAPLIMFLPQNTLITYLFIKFYINTYWRSNTHLKSS